MTLQLQPAYQDSGVPRLGEIIQALDAEFDVEIEDE